MSNWAPEFLTQSDFSHLIPSPRLEGEASLAELARKSKVEYAWEFDEVAQQWRYSPGINFASTSYQNGRVFGVKNGLTVNEELHYPVGTSSSFYHIHPEWDITRIQAGNFDSSLAVQAQIPSTEDIEACVRFTLNGYRDIRIVTVLGVTSLIFNETEKTLRDGFVDLPGTSLSNERLAKISSSKTAHAAIEYAFNALNEHYDGALDFQYERRAD